MATPTPNALAVAGFLIALGEEEGIAVTPKALLKLMYLVNGWALEEFGNTLFDDTFEAWKQGPVIRGVWEMNRGSAAPIQSIDGADISRLTDDQKDLVRQVWNCYKGRSTGALERITHDSAWYAARGPLSSAASSDAPIPTEAIRASFSGRCAEAMNTFRQLTDSIVSEAIAKAG